MAKLLILRGIPGSGKSTWAKAYVEKNKDWVRVNRDDLRNMRGIYWLPKQEKLITMWENLAVAAALTNGYNVILDSTNMDYGRNGERIDYLRKELSKQGYTYLCQFEVETINFTISLEEAIKRDLARPNSVGEKVIRTFYDKYIAPPVPKYTEDKTLPHCVIFDVDGTLAKMSGRSPFEWDKVKTDKVNEPVADILDKLQQDRAIIIFTGRDGSCLEATKEWLQENGIYYDHIYIRPAGNQEKDSIIKKRLFEENIRGQYYCDFVVDDRDQVVSMWRKELGLTCFQVNYGDF